MNSTAMDLTETLHIVGPAIVSPYMQQQAQQLLAAQSAAGMADAGAREPVEDAAALLERIGRETPHLAPLIAEVVQHTLSHWGAGKPLVEARLGETEVSVSTATRILGLEQEHLDSLLAHRIIPSRQVDDDDQTTVRLMDVLAYQSRVAHGAALLAAMEVSGSLGDLTE